MKTKIETKSAVIGACLGVAAMLAIGAASPQPQTVGRYQLGGTAAHGMVIDTATGQVWTTYLPQNTGISADAAFSKPKPQESR